MGVQLGLGLGGEHVRSVRWIDPNSGFAMLVLSEISKVGLPTSWQPGRMGRGLEGQVDRMLCYCSFVFVDAWDQ